jgi:hypothetical protein
MVVSKTRTVFLVRYLSSRWVTLFSCDSRINTGGELSIGFMCSSFWYRRYKWRYASTGRYHITVRKDARRFKTRSAAENWVLRSEKDDKMGGKLNVRPARPYVFEIIELGEHEA